MSEMLDIMADTDLSHRCNGPLDNAIPSRAPCRSIPARTRPWACIVTHAQAERWAEANLRRIGYEVFLPLYAALVRDPVLHTRTRPALKPLFPGYMFLRFDHRAESWSPIRASPGVVDILRSDGQTVAYAPEAAISALQASEASRRTMVAPGAVWAAGDPCRLVLEPFLGADAVVIAKAGPDRLRVAMLMLGAMREVTVFASSIAPRQ